MKISSELPYKELVPTGISGLDEILRGGLRRGHSLVLEGMSGTGRTTLAMEYLFQGATQFDEAGCFISLNTSRINLIRDCADFSWDLLALEEAQLLRFVDTDAAVLADDLKKGCCLLAAEIKKYGFKRLVIDGISGLDRHFDKTEKLSYLEALTNLFRTLQAAGITSILTVDLKQASSIGESGSSEVHFAADAIISLGNQPRGKSVHRYLEVIKSRGQFFFSGRHSVKISSGLGMRVFPRASVRTGDFNPEDYQPTSDTKVSIGNPILDDMLGGGVYLGSVTLITGISGTGKSIAALQFLMEGARNGQKGLLISLDEHPQQVRRNAKSLDIDLAGEEEKGNIILAYDGPLELNLDIHLRTIKNLIDKHQVTRVVIDSLASYELVHPQEAREFIFSLATFLKKHLIASIFNYESPELLGVSQISKDIKASAIVDNIVLLSYVEISTLLRRAITVPKSRGSKPAQRTKEYLIQQGGISILDDESISNVASVPQLPLSSYYGVLARSPTRTSPVIDESLASGSDLPASNMPKPPTKRIKTNLTGKQSVLKRGRPARS